MKNYGDVPDTRNQSLYFDALHGNARANARRSDVTSCAMRFVGIVSERILNYANDLNDGYSGGACSHPVSFRNT